METHMLGFKILADGIFSEEDIEISYNPDCGRAVPKDPDTESLIETQWNARVQQAKQNGVKLFNGMLFRLARLKTTETNKLLLELGNTDYREYIGTRAKEFHQNRSFDSLANPLAICAAIVSAEGSIIIEKRGRVDVYSGHYHVIGGFMDRSADFDNGIPNPFKAIKREVHEEVALELESINLRSLGVVYDLITPHPEMCFYVELGLPFKEMADIFSSHDTDREVHEIESIDSSRLDEFITSRHGHISVTGEACLLLYGKHRYGQEWFRKVIDVISTK